jgi:ribonuclease-3
MIDQGVQQIESPATFAMRLNLPISDIFLLSRALTHRSYLNENPDALEDNERLEFLGDAVLDFLVGAWLYNNYPEKREGELTRLRSALVRTEQLAEFARQIDLGAAMRLGKGEAEAGGRQRLALLCGTFEALVGALYLNAGMDAVMDFMEPMLSPASEQILLGHKDQDPKSILQELVQSQGFAPPVYETVLTRGPEHSKTFDVVVKVNGQVAGGGSGTSKQSAAKAAALKALENLEMALSADQD